jgi:hypothetical protein
MKIKVVEHDRFPPRPGFFSRAVGDWPSASHFDSFSLREKVAEGRMRVKKAGRSIGLALVSMLLCTDLVSAEQPKVPVGVGVFPQEMRTFHTEADGLPGNDVHKVAVIEDGRIAVRTAKGNALLEGGEWIATTGFNARFAAKLTAPLKMHALTAKAGGVLAVAHGPTGQVAVGTQKGLFLSDNDGARQVFPRDGHKSWAPTNVTVSYDGLGRLWFASYQGAGRYAYGKWTLFTGAEGLPYDDMTAVAGCADGTVWFGTGIGAIRYDGSAWAYRQGKRWLPNDEVRDIAVDAAGNAWVATAGGVSFIHFKGMTLAEKAKHYEDEIDKYNRRTKFGYVIEAHAPQAGKKTGTRVGDSDNDGLWTSMYGAGECFAYGATKDPLAKRRAKRAFAALSFLSEAPKGSEHEPPRGFIARTVLETTAADPNLGSYTLENQRRTRKGKDGYWRVYEPRWPKSADGKYYWKSDTSSDELDGHYFFYPLYYDLVAETEAEKSAVREVVRANIDHLIRHDFSMHDHAGKTRWSVYGPEDMNQDIEWHTERGLKSISILSYLNVAYHMTGDKRYRAVAKELRDKHSYHINAMWPKYQRGIGSGNHSDDEMAFMSYYNLVKYEPNPKLKKLYMASFANSWRQEEPEMNPFFNFCFASQAMGVEFTTIWGTFDLSPWETWIEDSIGTLKRFPLDRFDWRHTNHHRKDLTLLSDHWADAYDGEIHNKGYRNNGKVLPVDESYFNHWNTNPWELDTGGGGHVIGSGTVYTLPYYMGLYHGFIAAD